MLYSLEGHDKDYQYTKNEVKVSSVWMRACVHTHANTEREQNHTNGHLKTLWQSRYKTKRNRNCHNQRSRWVSEAGFVCTERKKESNHRCADFFKFTSHPVDDENYESWLLSHARGYRWLQRRTWVTICLDKLFQTHDFQQQTEKSIE